MRKFLPLVFLAVLSGCAGATFVRTGDRKFASRDKNCEIEVFLKAPVKKGREICVIKAKSGQATLSDRSLDGMIPDAKAQACECGADAIVLKSSTDGKIGMIGGGALGIGDESGTSTWSGLKY